MKINNLATAFLGVLLLTACAPATLPQPTPDVNAIRTSAAYTVVAEFTLTAAVLPPTALLPTETSIAEQPTATSTEGLTTDPTLAALGTPAALCDDYVWEVSTLDVTIPDGTPMTPGQEFTKTWRIKNAGICTWGEGYVAIYSYSTNTPMKGQPVPLDKTVAPGEEVEVSVIFKAPNLPGDYSGYWAMVNPQGIPFGKKEYTMIVKITVQ